MHDSRSNTLLRYALIADALASGATAILLVAGAGVLAGLLGLPTALLREAGLVLVPYVAFVAYVGTRATISRPPVQAIIACNAVWAAASILLLVTDYVAPTALGYAFVIGQAAVVAVFGELQYVGLRRPEAATA